jgi:hypothetical protein
VKKLTIEESIKLHRELWGWLAKNPKKNKEDWPGWEQIAKEYPELATREEVIDSHCFACYATNQFTPGNCLYEACSDCVLDWPGENCCNDNPDDGKGLFMEWDYAERLKTRRKLAIQIRDLPVRERSHREAEE